MALSLCHPAHRRDSGNPPRGLGPQGCWFDLIGFFPRNCIQLNTVKRGDWRTRNLNLLFGYFSLEEGKDNGLLSSCYQFWQNGNISLG